eukprot:SAG11_NODE_515_length_8826_cov_11.352469_7_plen_62_part_00
MHTKFSMQQLQPRPAAAAVTAAGSFAAASCIQVGGGSAAAASEGVREAEVQHSAARQHRQQ